MVLPLDAELIEKFQFVDKFGETIWVSLWKFKVNKKEMRCLKILNLSQGYKRVLCNAYSGKHLFKANQAYLQIKAAQSLND